MKTTEEHQHFDVFLSYNSADIEIVKRIALALEDAGLKVWFDQLALLPGDPWMANLTRGLAASASCAVLIGKELGRWQQVEAELALQRVVERK